MVLNIRNASRKGIMSHVIKLKNQNGQTCANDPDSVVISRDPKQHRCSQQVFHFVPPFSWRTGKGKLCDGTNTADERNGTNWEKGLARSRSPLDLPFLALFTVHARGAAAAASADGKRQAGRKEGVGRTK